MAGSVTCDLVHPRLAQAGQAVPFYTVRTTENTGFTDFPRGPWLLSAMSGRGVTQWQDWDPCLIPSGAERAPYYPTLRGTQVVHIKKHKLQTDRPAFPFSLAVKLILGKCDGEETESAGKNRLVAWFVWFRNWGLELILAVILLRVSSQSSASTLPGGAVSKPQAVSSLPHGPLLGVAHSTAAGFPWGEQERGRRAIPGGNHNFLATWAWQ